MLPAMLAAVVLGGCTSAPSLEPVPTVAPSPFLCAGVPRTSAELILGGDVEADETGVWKGNPFAPFKCTITRVGRDDLDGYIWILPNPIAWIGEDTDDFLIQYMGGPEHATPMTADAPGRGFTSSQKTDDQAGAVWVCDGFATKVALTSVDIEGRDAEEDAANLLRSMLPWACGDEDVPPASD